MITCWVIAAQRGESEIPDVCVCVCVRVRGGRRFNVLHWEHNFNAALILPLPPFGSEWSFCILRLFFPSTFSRNNVSHFLNRLIYCKPTATLLWLVARAFPFPAPPPPPVSPSLLFFFAVSLPTGAKVQPTRRMFTFLSSYPPFSTWLDRECTGSSFNRERFQGHSVRVAFFLKLPHVKSIWMRRELRRDFWNYCRMDVGGRVCICDICR